MPPPISAAELDVLKILWDHGPLTVREVEVRLRKIRRRWAYNTILTLLSRLRDKGYVASDKPDAGGGTAHVFRAAVSREQMVRHGLTDLADRMCDGTASPLVHALVQQGQRLSADDIAQLRRLLDDVERENATKPPPRE
jgi:BlaI family penicillinase repressor